VIEVPREHSVPWGSPNDADEALILSVKQQSKLPHNDGFHVLFGDGRVERLTTDLPSSERRAAISIAGNDN
jgi:prepilin-type processing-associated H-X9-DG protein